LWNVHDGDGDSGNDVGYQVALDVVVEEPVGEGEILIENFLPLDSASAELISVVFERR